MFGVNTRSMGQSILFIFVIAYFMTVGDWLLPMLIGSSDNGYLKNLSTVSFAFVSGGLISIILVRMIRGKKSD